MTPHHLVPYHAFTHPISSSFALWTPARLASSLFLKTTGTFLPQGICFLCPECPCLRCAHGFLPWPHQLTFNPTPSTSHILFLSIFPPYHLSLTIILHNLLLYCSLLVPPLECKLLKCVICLFSAVSLVPRISA